jgi:Flp pilus assembly protein TadB
MTAALLLGAVFAAGVLTFVVAWRPRRVALVTALEDLGRPRWLADDRHHPRSLAARLVAARGGLADRRSDLEITERTVEQQAVRTLTAAAAMAAIPVAAGVLAVLAGISVSLGITLLPAIVLAGVGFVVPDIELRTRARERRTVFLHALSSYLDVTAVLLAGGAGTETALYAAAELGTGWPQQQLRTALDRCRLTGQAPWETLAELGDRLEITELSQLATSLALAGEQGARVRLTLTERARTLRASQLAEIEARARAVTEQMSVPVALLAVAFMLFVGFPAVWVVLGEL